MSEIKEIVTLSDYYEALPKPTSPKTEFVKMIAEATGKEEATVRLWFKNKTKPNDPKDLEILSQKTGIAIENLFAE